MSTISAGTTLTTALVQTGDTTGNLVINTGGSNTTAMTIDTSQNVGIGTSSPGSYAGFKTLALNGSTGGALDFLNNGTREGSIYNAGTSFNIKTFTASPILFATNNAATQLTLDTSGNLGLGVTPNQTSGVAMEFGGSANNNAINFLNSGNAQGWITSNAYYNGTNWLRKYASGTTCTAYATNVAGTHAWYVAPASTAGSTISWTQAMTLDASGNLGIGTSSPGYKLHTNNGDVYFQNGNVFIQDDNKALVFGTGTTSYIIGSSTNNNQRFITNGTEQMRIDSSGNLKFNSGYGSAATAYGCRAWVNFNGTGTVAIRASGNVSSITDNNTGDYTVNFSTAMPDANYAVTGSALGSNGNWAYTVMTGYTTTLAAGSVRFRTGFSNAEAYYDIPYVSITVVR